MHLEITLLHTCRLENKQVHTIFFLLTQLNRIYEDEILLTDWFAAMETILSPKIDLTDEDINYRPIACPNITYKIYTDMINNFLKAQWSVNDIITLEQTRDKKSSWGFAVQQFRANIF